VIWVVLFFGFWQKETASFSFRRSYFFFAAAFLRVAFLRFFGAAAAFTTFLVALLFVAAFLVALRFFAGLAAAFFFVAFLAVAFFATFFVARFFAVVLARTVI
jgi:hypothetical protein